MPNYLVKLPAELHLTIQYVVNAGSPEQALNAVKAWAKEEPNEVFADGFDGWTFKGGTATLTYQEEDWDVNDG